MSRSVLRSSLVLVLAGLGVLSSCGARGTGPVVQPAVAPSSPWPMFRGDATHRGDWSTARTPRGVIRWQVALRERIDASPLIDGLGRVVVATRTGTVAALDPVDGKMLARARLPSGVWATPAIVGDTVVVAAKDGNLHGLSTLSLAPKWKLSVGREAFSALTVVGERLFLCAGENLIAVDGAAGATPVVVWSRALDDRCYTAPVFSAELDTLFIGDRSGTVTAVAVDDGTVRWRNAPTPDVAIDGSGALGDGLVYFGGNDGAMRAYDTRSGSVRFSVVGAAWVVSTPAVVEGAVVYGDDDGVVRSVATDGTSQKWQARVGGDVASAPTAVGALIVHASHDGYLYGRNPKSGEQVFKLALGAPAYASVALHPDGGLVIGTHVGDVVFIE